MRVTIGTADGYAGKRTCSVGSCKMFWAGGEVQFWLSMHIRVCMCIYVGRVTKLCGLRGGQAVQ